MRRSGVRTCQPPQTVRVVLKDYFDCSHADPGLSPIDHFVCKHKELNKFCTPHNIQEYPVLAGLALLGSVSAVESYLREIIRRLIILDPASQRACYNKDVSYGAALVHSKEMLPDALIEQYSFANKQNVMGAFKDLLGMKIQTTASEDGALNDFQQICHFRHCMVHRFGRLGVSNAVKLGQLRELENYIDKPLLVDNGRLQTVFQISYNTVRVLNGFLYNKIVERLGNEGRWTWDLRRDKRRFRPYFDLFYSTIEPPTPDCKMQDAYKQYRHAHGSQV